MNKLVPATKRLWALQKSRVYDYDYEGFIYSFIQGIYIAPLQGSYSEVIPTPTRSKRTVFKISINSLLQRSERLYGDEYNFLISHVYTTSQIRLDIYKSEQKLVSKVA